MNITKEQVDKAIEEIKKEIKGFPISEKNLVKFTNSKIDQDFKSYIDGVGGYYHKFIPMVMEKLGLKNILELGNREGVSTLCIFDHLHDDMKLTTVDIIEDLRYCPPAFFSDKKVRIVTGDVIDLNIYQTELPKNVDFIFLDTIHYDFQATDEFEVYQHFLSDTALVAIDDTHVNDKGNFFDRITYPKWDLTELCHGSGWGLFLYQRRDDSTEEERLLKAYKASSKIWKRKYNELETIVGNSNKKKISKILRRILKKNPIIHKTLIKLNNKTLKIK